MASSLGRHMMSHTARIFLLFLFITLSVRWVPPLYIKSPMDMGYGKWIATICVHREGIVLLTVKSWLKDGSTALYVEGPRVRDWTHTFASKVKAGPQHSCSVLEQNFSHSSGLMLDCNDRFQKHRYHGAQVGGQRLQILLQMGYSHPKQGGQDDTLWTSSIYWATETWQGSHTVRNISLVSAMNWLSRNFLKRKL